MNRQVKTVQSIALFVFVLSLICVSISACTSLPTPDRTPYVIKTAWVAVIYGRLVEEDGCLEVIVQNNQSVAYTLVWPPDVSASITNCLAQDAFFIPWACQVPIDYLEQALFVGLFY